MAKIKKNPVSKKSKEQVKTRFAQYKNLLMVLGDEKIPSKMRRNILQKSSPIFLRCIADVCYNLTQGITKTDYSKTDLP